MKIISLFEGNMEGLATLIFLVLFAGFGIPIILLIVGAFKYSRGDKKKGKTLLIIAGVYLLISGGVCLSLIGL